MSNSFEERLAALRETAARQPMGSGGRPLKAPKVERREALVKPASASRSLRPQRSGMQPDSLKAVQTTARTMLRKYPGIFTSMSFEIVEGGKRMQVTLPIQGNRIGRPTVVA